MAWRELWSNAQRMTGLKSGAHRIRVENIGKGDATVLFLGLIIQFYLRY
jgi:hypothetical protein